MQLTKLAIHRPVTTLMGTLALIFLGVISYRELPVQLFPDVTFPVLSYNATFLEGDRSPEETNRELTVPIEKLAASLQGVKEMYSQTSSGWFYGYARFSGGTDTKFREIELQDRVNKWLAGRDDRRQISINVRAESIEQNSGRLMLLILSIPIGHESRIAAATDLIDRKLGSIDGIARVEISGEMRPRLTLLSESDELTAIGLGVNSILDAINLHARDRSWLGTLFDAGKRREVSLISKVETEQELKDLAVDERGVHRVGSVTRFEERVDQGDRIFRRLGKKAVSVTVHKETERNTIRMAKAVRLRIEELRGELPPGFELNILQDEAESLETMIGQLIKMASIGAALAMLVLLVFVRSWRIALVVGISIPASIIITFNAMYAVGLSVNILSLFGIAIAVGVLIDNAIVVVENVFRHARFHRDPREAAWQGSREITRAIIIATATTLAVFVPLLFIDDDGVAAIIRPMALSLAFPLAASLLIALTLIPMLASKVLGHKAKAAPPNRPSPRSSRRAAWNPWRKPNRRPRNFLHEFVLFFTKAALRHPVRLLSTISVLLFVTALAGLLKVGLQGGLQTERTREIELFGKAPLGSTLDEVDLQFREKEVQVREVMESSEAVESFRSNFDNEGGTIILRIASEYQDLPPNEFHEAFGSLRSGDASSGFRFRPFPRATAQASGFPSIGRRSGGGREMIRVTGEDIDAMIRGAEVVERMLKSGDDVSDIYIDLPMGTPEVRFKPDLELIRVLNADFNDLQLSFQAATIAESRRS